MDREGHQIDILSQTAEVILCNTWELVECDLFDESRSILSISNRENEGEVSFK